MVGKTPFAAFPTRGVEHCTDTGLLDLQMPSPGVLEGLRRCGTAHDARLLAVPTLRLLPITSQFLPPAVFAGGPRLLP